jgi:capsular polysaccharide transport system permease protein
VSDVSPTSPEGPEPPEGENLFGAFSARPEPASTSARPDEVKRVLPLSMPGRRDASGVAGVPSPAERLKDGSAAPASAAAPPAAAGRAAEGAPPALVQAPTLTVSLPQRRRRMGRTGLISFALMVVLPTVLAAIYFFGMAASQYSSEFHFTVRDNSSITPSSGSNQFSSLASALGGSAAGSDVLSNYTVIDYLQSRQALEDVGRRLPLRNYFAIGGPDLIAKLGSKANMEQFTRYWRRMVYANYDPATGLAVVRVRTFDPKASLALADALMGAAEGVVNQIEIRARSGAQHYADRELAIDRQLNSRQNAAATALRRRAGTVDPVTGDVGVQIATLTQLNNTLAQLQSQYSAASAQIKDPNSPALTSIKAQIDSTQRQIASVKALTGRGAALPGTVTDFETLQQNRTLTTAALASTYSNLETARANADMQHLYLMDGVRPSMPTSSDYPNRPLAVFLVALASLGVWLVATLVASSLRAHLA